MKINLINLSRLDNWAGSAVSKVSLSVANFFAFNCLLFGFSICIRPATPFLFWPKTKKFNFHLPKHKSFHNRNYNYIVGFFFGFAFTFRFILAIALVSFCCGFFFFLTRRFIIASVIFLPPSLLFFAFSLFF